MIRYIQAKDMEDALKKAKERGITAELKPSGIYCNAWWYRD